MVRIYLFVPEALIYVTESGTHHKRIEFYKSDSKEHFLNSLPILGNKLEFSRFFTCWTCKGIHYLYSFKYVTFSGHMVECNFSISFGVRCGHVTCLANEVRQKELSLAVGSLRSTRCFAPFSHSSSCWLAQIKMLAVLSG